MRWLYVTTQYPWPLCHGIWLRVYNIAKELVAIGDDVAVVSFVPEEKESQGMFETCGASFLPAADRHRLTRGPSRTFVSPYIFQPALAEAIEQHASYYDAVVLCGPVALQYSYEAKHCKQVIVDLVDDPVMEYRRRKFGEMKMKSFWHQVNFMARYPRYEKHFLKGINLATFVSEKDAQQFAIRNPEVPAMVSTNGVDFENMYPPVGRKRKHHHPRVVFTGVMNNHNNEVAAEYLVTRIAPKLWDVFPELEVVLAGAKPSEDVLALASDRVTVTGTVDDIRPWFWDSDVVVLPMQSGTGIKNKLLEAWASGTPVVASPLAVGGTPAIDGRDVLLAIRPEDYAQEILRVIKEEDIRQKLIDHGYQSARNFNWSSIAKDLRGRVKPISFSRLIDKE